MTKAIVKLFVSSTCPNCPAAKNEINQILEERDDFELKLFDLHTREGVEEAKKLQIMSVPTYIITGPGVDHNIGLVGSQGSKTLNKYLDFATGKKDMNKKESFWKKLFS